MVLCDWITYHSMICPNQITNNQSNDQPKNQEHHTQIRRLLPKITKLPISQFLSTKPNPILSIISMYQEKFLSSNPRPKHKANSNITTYYQFSKFSTFKNSTKIDENCYNINKQHNVMQNQSTIITNSQPKSRTIIKNHKINTTLFMLIQKCKSCKFVI